jgi:small-conductance mechanosensitive channel
MTSSMLGTPSIIGPVRAPGLPRQEDIDALSDALDTGGIGPWDWAMAAGILIGSIVVAQLAKWLFTRLFARRVDRALAVLIARVAGYVIVTIGLIYALDSLGVRIGPLLGALGVLGIALAFALKDILENFVAGVMLQLRRPFTYGDEIVVDEHVGSVTDIDGRLVTMTTPEGETVMIPSATVIKSDVVNYTTVGRRRTDVEVGVAYGTRLDEAQRVLADAVASVDEVLDDPAPDVLLTAFGESSIDFVVRYWHGPSIATFWRARDEVVLAIDARLAEAGITVPFPQRRLWIDRSDG